VRERVGVRVSIAKALILITLILTFSLEGRRNNTFYNTLPVRERFGVRVSKANALISITLILGSGFLLRSTSSFPGVVIFSLEGRRNKTFYDTLMRERRYRSWY